MIADMVAVTAATDIACSLCHLVSWLRDIL